ncbi:MAG: ABC transporter substrate-binding protein [Chloroflexota bacterium]|nr:ABC transporter substrate-binding protein [Dehalococcoidia bacterium]MDW8252494.1 ABC transporter substrate-binding protein [Chloroflexota bacterium]
MRWPRAALVLAISASACAPATAPAQTGAPAQPAVETRAAQQVIQIGTAFSMSTLSPRGALPPAPFLYWPMYDNLTQFGPKYEVKPSVAERWSVSPDGRTWTFNLRRDVKFWNGQPLTAEDVAFSLMQVIRSRWPAIGFFTSVTEATAVDPWTVTVTTRQPDMAIPNGGAYLWIIPKAYYEEIGADAFSDRAIGSGPYEVAEYRPGDFIRYRKRSEPHAFRKPQNDEIVFRTIPEAAQRANGLRTGELDLAAGTSFPPDIAESLMRAGITVLSQPGAVVLLSMSQGVAEARNTPLKDKRVRLALNYAIDRESIAKNLYKGTAVPISQVALPGSPYFDESVRPIPYDPAQARRLLAEAGYPNGFKLPAGLDTSMAHGYRDLLLAIQGQLKEIGVEFDINFLESGEYDDRTRATGGKMRGDLWAHASSDANGFGSTIRSIYGCGKPVAEPAYALFWCNPAWDRLMDEALATPDPVRRQQLLHEANRIQREDVPAIYVVATPVQIAHTPKIRGVEFPVPIFYGFDTVYKIQ